MMENRKKKIMSSAEKGLINYAASGTALLKKIYNVYNIKYNVYNIMLSE